MGDFLAVLCFSLLIGGQFLAVIVVHRLNREQSGERPNVPEKMPGLSVGDLHVLAEKPGGLAPGSTRHWD